jgi:hypothetical protein
MKGFKNSTRMSYMDEGISTRPTDDSGRRMTNAELNIARAPEPKPMSKGIGAANAAVTMGKKAGSMMKAPIRRKAGGLACMPKKK